MSSSWIDREKLLHTDSFAALPADLQARFAALEEQVGRCLSAAAALGNVVVITNAEAGWVEYSSKRFMPRLQPLLAPPSEMRRSPSHPRGFDRYSQSVGRANATYNNAGRIRGAIR